MTRFISICLALFLISCSAAKPTYYIVRHAEKADPGANMSSDVPLSSEGQSRAEALKTSLENKGITQIYSTNYIRTTSTAKPLSESKGIRIETYNPGDTAFITRLKNIQKGNVLIVGHSNTVDDIVNKLVGQQLLTDLPDTSYGDMFIVKGKKLKRSTF